MMAHRRWSLLAAAVGILGVVGPIAAGGGPEDARRAGIDEAVKSAVDIDAGPAPRAEQEQPPRRGITVTANPAATGDALAFQRWAADRLNQRDYVPAARIAHFTRTHGGPEAAGGIASFLGWNGTIQGVESTEVGLMIRVKVAPKHPGGKAVLNDDVEESYLFDGASLRYAGTTVNERPRITTFN